MALNTSLPSWQVAPAASLGQAVGRVSARSLSALYRAAWRPCPHAFMDFHECALAEGMSMIGPFHQPEHRG